MSQPRPTWVRYRVLGWLCLMATLAYVCRSGLSVAESTIREQLALTTQQSGWLLSAFFWSYALFQVPGGLVGHVWGTRIAVTLFVITWSCATAAFGLGTHLWMLFGAQLAMGVAQAGLFPCSVNSISDWMPTSRRAFSSASLGAAMQVGAASAAVATGLLILTMSWRWVFILYCLPGIVAGVWFAIRFRNLPEEDASVNAAELTVIRGGQGESTKPQAHKAEPTPWLTIALRPTMWFLFGQQVFRSAGYMFFASWFPTFLQKSRNVSISESGFLQGTVFAATLVGGLSGGVVIDWIWQRTGSLRWSRQGMGVGSLSLCGLLTLAAYFVHDAWLAVLLMAVGAFFAAISGPCTLAACIDMGGKHIPQVFGMVNMFGNFSAAACPILVAAFVEATGSWNLVVVLFGAVYLAGAGCWAFVNPNVKVTRLS